MVFGLLWPVLVYVCVCSRAVKETPDILLLDCLKGVAIRHIIMSVTSVQLLVRCSSTTDEWMVAQRVAVGRWHTTALVTDCPVSNPCSHLEVPIVLGSAV